MSYSPSYFWKEVPSNTLSQHSYGSQKTLKYTRIIGLVSTIPLSVWTFFLGSKAPYYVFSYLTDIGCYFCMFYFILIFFAQHDADTRLRWKIVYALGEISCALETLIAPFFWVALFRPSKADTEFILNGILLHFGLTVLMWAEVVQNQMAFPKRHRIFLFIIGVLYIIDNLIFSLVDHPVYSLITWKSWQSYLYILISAIVVFLGFEIGRCQYNRKLKKNKIPNTLSRGP